MAGLQLKNDNMDGQGYNCRCHLSSDLPTVCEQPLLACELFFVFLQLGSNGITIVSPGHGEPKSLPGLEHGI